MSQIRKFSSLPALVVAVLISLTLSADDRISVTGVDGVTVTLDEPAGRIVSLAPHLSELLFTAGAGEALVGAVEYSDHPPAAAEVPRVGDAFRVDLERVLSLEPDLVLAWESGNPADAVTRLRDLGVPVLVTEVRDLADIARQLRELGRLAGTPEAAEHAARGYERAIASLRRQYGDRDVVRVFYQATANPLYTVGGGHVITQAIELCGGRNVFESLDVLAPTVSEEAVLAADPDVIVAGTQSSEASPLERWHRWQGMTAVAEGHLHALDANVMHRSTTRIAEGIGRLCELVERAR